MLTTQSLNSQANPKCVIVNDCESQDKLPELLRAASRRGKNRLVLTTTDLFNQKLKSIRSTYFKDRSTIVQMPELNQQQMRSILTAAYTKEKLTYKNKSFQDTPIQLAYSLITQIINVCGQDIRQGLQQLEFCISQRARPGGVQNQLTQFQLAQQIFCGQGQPEEVVDQWFADPMQTHAFLIQNYQTKDYYNLRYA